MRTDLEYHNEILSARPFHEWQTNESTVRVVSGQATYDVELVKQRVEDVVDSYGFTTGTGQAWMTFKVSYNDVGSFGGLVELFFKKEGIVDFYHGVVWEGAWTRVLPKKREVVSYEFV